MSIEERRSRQILYDKLSPIIPDINRRNLGDKKVATVHVAPQEKSQGVLLYLHGGAYVLGMTNNHINLCGRLAKQALLEVFLPDYRLAPEYPFPAALEDVLAVYQYLVNHCAVNNPIFIGGDSAGGGLALALLQTIREKNLKIPSAVFLLSPWTDLTLSGESIRSNQEKDPILSPKGLDEDASLYAGNHSLKDPLISPIFALMREFPPLLAQVGSDEILLDDTRLVAKHAKEQNLSIEIRIWDKMFHVFQLFPMLPEAEEAINDIIRFINFHKNRDTTA